MSTFRSSLAYSVRYRAAEKSRAPWMIVGKFNSMSDAELFAKSISGQEIENVFGLFHKNRLQGEFQKGDRAPEENSAPRFGVTGGNVVTESTPKE